MWSRTLHARASVVQHFIASGAFSAPWRLRILIISSANPGKTQRLSQYAEDCRAGTINMTTEERDSTCVQSSHSRLSPVSESNGYWDMLMLPPVNHVTSV